MLVKPKKEEIVRARRQRGYETFQLVAFSAVLTVVFFAQYHARCTQYRVSRGGGPKLKGIYFHVVCTSYKYKVQ